MATAHRLLIIGIDGADHAMVHRWLAAGMLPNLGRLVSAGRLLAHRSTRPPLSAPAWTTAFTGCNPGKHGLYDFMDFSYPQRKPWWGLQRPCPTLWQRATAAGLRTVAVNVPMCYPAEEVDGALISGFGAPDLTGDAFYPRPLRESLLAAVADYALQPKLDPANWPSVGELNSYTDMCAKALRHLLGSQSADLVWVGFNALDWAGHAYAARGSEPGSPLVQVAACIDDNLGDVLSAVDWPRTAVMVVSDHGMRCARRQVNLPKLFSQMGLMQFEGGCPSTGTARSALVLRAWHLAKRVLPSAAISRLRRSAGAKREALVAEAQVRIDWEQTIAAPIGAYGCVRLNVLGRDAQGIVRPEDYDAVAQDVALRLRAATDGVGQPLFDEVALRDEIYSGPQLDGAPDIVLWPHADDMAFGAATSESELLLFTSQAGIVTRLNPPTGVHGNQGILLLSGEAFAEPAQGDECQLADLTPTALAVLGLPIPAYMDGAPLAVSASAGEGELETGVTDSADQVVYSEEEEELLAERLRALGYM